MLLMSSDPATGSVAPHGAIAGRFTPNPIAAGFPTDGLPVLIDISASTTTNGLVSRLNRAGKGERLPGPWLVDNRGDASDDPAVFLTDPPGAILPLGGMDLGHKGFGLALLVEALTSALAGHGRADGEKRWGAVGVRADHRSRRVRRPRRVRARDGLAGERLPDRAGQAGQSAGARCPASARSGCASASSPKASRCTPRSMPALVPWAKKLGVAMPAA